jgi:hypothetical protein
MKHIDAMYILANSILERFKSSDYANQIGVDLYEIEVGRLSDDRRYNIRLGLFPANENPSASVAGTPFRGVRVDWGWPLDTIQQYSVQISVRIPDLGQNDDGNESVIIDVTDILNAWANGIGRTIAGQTDCYYSALVWGGSQGVRRLGNIAYTYATLYAQRQTPNPNE